MLKISKNGFVKVRDIFNGLKKECSKEVLNNIQMTEFIQILIDSGIKIKPIYINGNWMEIDFVSDLFIDMIE